jgi:hypothetical protein
LALIDQFLLAQDGSRDARWLRNHLDEALRDAGTHGSRAQVIRVNKTRARHVYQNWTVQRDHRRRAQALLVASNLFRTLDDYHTALRCVDAAQWILEGFCPQSDVAVKLCLHPTILLKLKIIATDCELPRHVTHLEGQFLAHYPTFSVEESEDALAPWSDLTVHQYGLAAATVFPLTRAMPAEPDPLNTLVGTLDNLAAGEAAGLQILLTPCQAP